MSLSLSLIEERRNVDPKYEDFLMECHAVYVAARDSLMSPVVSVVALQEMVTSHGRNYCSLYRNSSRMMMHVCRDEYSLWRQFFSASSPLFDEFLLSLSLHLYNCLRPIIIIIHANHFETLSELCLLIKEEIMNDDDDDDYVSIEFE